MSESEVWLLGTVPLACECLNLVECCILLGWDGREDRYMLAFRIT